jgi:EpsI family protein
VLRRNLLIGSACLAAAGAAFALTPRRVLSRLGAARLDQVAPAHVPGWSWRDVTGLAPPSTADDLVAQLYDQVLERIFISDATGNQIMMMLAHGASQTNELQLHRPEVCYPAFGYQLSNEGPLLLAVAPGVAIPGRKFVASAPGQQESVVYWTRIGDSLPTDARGQRTARLRAEIDGYVCDGVLARFSTTDLDPAPSFALLQTFIPRFLAAAPVAQLPALVGQEWAATLERSRG